MGSNLSNGLASVEWAVQGSRTMLTGDQIAHGRRLASFATQADLARASKVSVPTVARAEAARGEVPDMGTRAMKQIIAAFERAGIEFELSRGDSPNGGLVLRLKKKDAAE